MLTVEFKEAYNKVARVELEDGLQWASLQEEVQLQTGATGADYFEVSKFDTKSGRPEILDLPEGFKATTSKSWTNR